MKKHSFTLIELLIVLVIIGVFAALAMPQYQKMVYNVKTGAETMRIAQAAADSIWRYYIETGRMPPRFWSTLSLMDELDVKFSDPDKMYFKYVYQCQPDGRNAYISGSQPDATKVPIGGISEYSIEYVYEPSVVQPWHQSMGNKWYRIYRHRINRIQNGSITYVVKYGWPGNIHD